MTEQNKYLEKMAFSPSSFFKATKAVVNEYPSAFKGGAIGAGVGGGLGSISSEKINEDGDYIKKTRGERLRSVLTGATIGGLYGASLGLPRDINRKANDAMKSGFRNGRYSGSSGGSSYSGNKGGGNSSYSHFDDLSQAEKDLGFPKGGFKTKAEATSHFRRTAMKNHPDKGGKVEDMQKINAAWDKYKKHPRGFNKLARLLYK